MLNTAVLRFSSLAAQLRPLPEVCAGLHVAFVEVAGQPLVGVAFGEDAIKVNRPGQQGHLDEALGGGPA